MFKVLLNQTFWVSAPAPHFDIGANNKLYIACAPRERFEFSFIFLDCFYHQVPDSFCDSLIDQKHSVTDAGHWLFICVHKVETWHIVETF